MYSENPIHKTLKDIDDFYEKNPGLNVIPRSLQKESEWEKEVRGVCRQDYIEQSEVDALVEYIQKATATAVANREKEIAEEVEKMKPIQQMINGEMEDTGFVEKEAVISVLKH